MLPIYISNAVLLKFEIKKTRQNVSISAENNKQRNCFQHWSNVCWAPDQHIRMISKGPCDTEDWSNGCIIHFKIYCNEVSKYGKKEAGTGEHLTHFNNKINKHNRNAAAPHGRLPHTKHKLKFQAWSSLVFHCCHSSFNPSEAPPWDSRPVSGAGVVHYQLLHRPRSVPTALGPAPLVTYIKIKIVILNCNNILQYYTILAHLTTLW